MSSVERSETMNQTMPISTETEHQHGGAGVAVEPVAKAVAEIAKEWDYNENGDWKNDKDFLNELHDPDTNGRVLLEGLVSDDVLTEGQWSEVLSRLRVLFPKEQWWSRLVPKEEDESEDDESDDEEDFSECIGCGKKVWDDDDYGNNADVADTCCKSCWEKEME